MGELGPENMQAHPWISATGAISNSDSSPGTFDVDPDQYTSAFKDLKGVSHTFPIRAHVDLTSKRYKNTKVSFKNGRFISLTGHLTQFQSGEDDSEQRFVIGVVNFDFLGYAPPPPAASSTLLSESAPFQHDTTQSKSSNFGSYRHTKQGEDEV